MSSDEKATVVISARVPAETKKLFKLAAEVSGSTESKMLTQLIDWYIHNGRLPGEEDLQQKQKEEEEEKPSEKQEPTEGDSPVIHFDEIRQMVREEVAGALVVMRQIERSPHHVLDLSATINVLREAYLTGQITMELTGGGA